MSNNWEIKTYTREDALHFSKIGAYAGFIWCAFIVLGVAIFALAQSGETTSSDTDLNWFFGEKAIVFWIALILSLRIYSGKGYLSAIGLLTFFIFYKILMVIAVAKFDISIFVNGLIAYGMYAGIRGTQALRKFDNNTKIDADIFD